MKKIICLIAAMMLAVIPLSACESAGADSESQMSGSTGKTSLKNDITLSEAEDTPAAIGGIEFGLTPQELLAVLEDKGIELEDAESMTEWTDSSVVVSDPVEDGRIYYLHDGLTFFVYETKGGDLIFEYDENGEAFAVFTDTSAYETDRGAKVGDTVVRVKELYGSNYYKGSHDGPENEVYYSYEQNGAYVIFEVYNSTDSDSDTVSRIYMSSSDFPFGD